MAEGEGTATPGDPGGEQAGPDAVEQIQRAVLTAIGATRVALDALEAMVADRSRIERFASNGREVVDSVVHSVTNLFGQRPKEPPAADQPGDPSGGGG